MREQISCMAWFLQRSGLPAALALFSAVYDVRSGIIPNRLLIRGIKAAILLRIAMTVLTCLNEHPDETVLYLAGQVLRGLWPCMTGGCLPILFPGALYYFRMIGAGDIKLLCVLGMMLGPGGILRCIVRAFLAGGAAALWISLKRKNLFSRLLYLKTYVLAMIREGTRRPYLSEETRDGTFPFSVCILAGVIWSLL